MLERSGATFNEICSELGFEPDAPHPGPMALLNLLSTSAEAGLITIDGVPKEILSSKPIWELVFSERDEAQKKIRASMQYVRTKEIMEHPFLAGYRDGVDYSCMARPVFGPPLDLPSRHDVFTLMPFNDESTTIYQDYVKPAIGRLGLTIMRADELRTNNAIMGDIWASIYGAGVVVAECTGCNPNVFYELGIAHTVGVPTVLMTRDIQSLPLI